MQNLGSISNDIIGRSLKLEKVDLSSWESRVPNVVGGCVSFPNSNDFRKVNSPPAKTPPLSWLRWNRNPLSWGFRSRSHRGGSCWSSWKPHVYIREKNLARPFPLDAVQDEIPSFRKLVSKKCWQVSVCVFNTVPSPVPCEWRFSSGLGHAFLSLCRSPSQNQPRYFFVISHDKDSPEKLWYGFLLSTNPSPVITHFEMVRDTWEIHICKSEELDGISLSFFKSVLLVE